MVKSPFYGGYGLVAEDGIPKPAYNAFALLHALGDARLPVESDDVLATRRNDGTLVVAAWNLVEPGAAGADKAIRRDVKGVAADARVSIRRVDAAHGDTLDAWKKMGSPKYPTASQVEALQKIAEVGAAETVAIRDHRLTVTLPPMGLAVIEIRR